jgi:hypothetical protein
MSHPADQDLVVIIGGGVEPAEPGIARSGVAGPVGELILEPRSACDITPWMGSKLTVGESTWQWRCCAAGPTTKRASPTFAYTLERCSNPI